METQLTHKPNTVQFATKTIGFAPDGTTLRSWKEVHDGKVAELKEQYRYARLPSSGLLMGAVHVTHS